MSRIQFPTEPDTLPKRTRHLVVMRPSTPQVGTMLADMFQIIGSQIGMLKTRAAISEINSQDALKLHKYAQILGLLSDQADKTQKELSLTGYSDAELQALTDKAQKLIGDGSENEGKSQASDRQGEGK